MKFWILLVATTVSLSAQALDLAGTFWQSKPISLGLGVTYVNSLKFTEDGLGRTETLDFYRSNTLVETITATTSFEITGNSTLIPGAVEIHGKISSLTTTTFASTDSFYCGPTTAIGVPMEVSAPCWPGMRIANDDWYDVMSVDGDFLYVGDSSFPDFDNSDPAHRPISLSPSVVFSRVP